VRILALVAAVLLGGLATTACIPGIGGDDPTPNPAARTNALQLAILTRDGQIGALPTLDEPYACVLEVALQPEAPEPTLHPVDSTCLWSVEEDGNYWKATLTETWRCDDFAAEAQGYPACVPPTGFHEWEYQVDLSTGMSTEVGSRGQFAPDMTH
jgi:hypothetical protein